MKGGAENLLFGSMPPAFKRAEENRARANAPSKARDGFDPEVEAAIDAAAREHGVDKDMLRTFANIESSGRPGARTGSYKGLFQLSDEEFAKNGGEGDIYNPSSNARAAALKMKAEGADFERQYGRQPSAAELYMIHQQGVGGSSAHWSNPDAPAWRNMASTAEGRQKGEGWARQAIWGNVPSDVRRRFGSVDNMTSRDFTNMWAEKVQRLSLGGPKSADDPSKEVLPWQQNGESSMPIKTTFAAPTAQTGGGEVLPWQQPAEKLPWQTAAAPTAAGPDMGQIAKNSIANSRREQMAKLLNGIAYSERPTGGSLEGASRVLAAVMGGRTGKDADDAALDERSAMVKLLEGASPFEQYAFASGDKDLQRAVVAKRMDPGLTSEQKNFRAAQADPNFASWYEKDQKARQPTAETEYDRTRGKQFAERAKAITDEETGARSSMSTSDNLRQLMRDPNFYSGAGAQGALLLKQGIAALGGDPNSAASMESFRALANKSVMDGLNGSLGTGVSNADRSFIEKQVASLDNTPEGNLKILELKDKVDQRKLEVANLARDYIRRNGRLDDGFDQEIADWAEKNKMFEGGETLSQRPTSGPFVQEHSTPAGQQSTNTAVRVQSVEEAQKLPAGTRFIDPNGIERVR